MGATRVSAQAPTHLEATAFAGAHLVDDAYLPAGVRAARGLRVALVRQTTGRRAWQRAYGRPRVGVSLAAASLGHETLAFAVAVAPFVEPATARYRGADLALRIGAGIAYTRRPHHPESNPGNRLYSSYLNYALRAGLRLSCPVAPRWQLVAGGSVTHLSNGALTKPNYGVNLLGADLGLRYAVRPIAGPAPRAASARADAVDEARGDEARLTRRRFRVYGLLGFGAKEVTHGELAGPTGELDAVFTAQAFLGYAANDYLEFQAGAIYFDHRGDRRRQRYMHANGWRLDYDAGYRRVALCAGPQIGFGRLALAAQIGYNVVHPFPFPPGVFQRYGLRHRLGHRFLGGVTLVAYGGRADFVEASIGYRVR